MLNRERFKDPTDHLHWYSYKHVSYADIAERMIARAYGWTLNTEGRDETEEKLEGLTSKLNKDQHLFGVLALILNELKRPSQHDARMREHLVYMKYTYHKHLKYRDDALKVQAKIAEQFGESAAKKVPVIKMHWSRRSIEKTMDYKALNQFKEAKTWEDLLPIKGVGPKLIAKWKAKQEAD